MIATVYVNGIVGEEATLMSVIRQVNSFSNPESVEVIIDSQGGLVDEGKAIYQYLKNLDIPVETRAIRAYSIAAHIFMAGDTRVVEEGEARLMIHFPFVSQMTGRSEDLRKMSEELHALEEEFVAFYTEHIKADEATVRRLLETETFLSGDEAFDLKLANSLEKPFPMKAVAYVKEPENKNTIMKNAEKLVKALQSFLKGDTDEAEVKALILQDANGTEIEFPDVAEDAQPAVGDRALVDGLPASGEYVAPSGETWVFTEGSLTEVRPAEETEEEEEATADESAETSTEVQETEANKEETTEEAEVEAENELDFEVLLEELFAKAKKEVTKELEEKINALRTENESLTGELTSVKKLLGSADIDMNPKEKEERKAADSPISALKNRRKK